MPLNDRRTANSEMQPLERAIRRAWLAIASERIWPRLVPILSIAGIYVVLSWLGFWRLGGDFARVATLGLLGLALLWSLIQLVRVTMPGRIEAMRRVELVSGLPHRPAHGLHDRMSAVADDARAKALWAAEQERLFATLGNLKVGPPRPDMPARDPHALRFVVPMLLVVAFAVAWDEWWTRLTEAFTPIAVAPIVTEARIDAWIDPPAYTRQAPIFLSRRTGPEAAQPVSVPEGSKLTVRVVSRDAAAVTLDAADGITALSPKAENPSGESEEVIRSYETALDRDATISIKQGEKTTAFPLRIIEDRPPTIARGPITTNQNGSFQLAFTITDDYGVTEGSVSFRAAEPQDEGARPLVEPPSISLRIDRTQARDGTARADSRLEAHPYAGLDVLADAFVKDAAGQEARPADNGAMKLPARPFYHPIARALIEQRQILALDANKRQAVANALDAITIAPEKIADSGTYLGIRVGYHRLVNARSDDDLRAVLDYLWQMARSIEDGDMSDAEQQLNAARQALEQALRDGASEEEISRLMNELRQAMQNYLESMRQEMQARGLENLPQMPSDQQMQMLTEDDLQQLLDRIEELARMGDMEAAQELLSQLQQMLDNLQMAQPGQMSPMDEETMRQMNELSRMMREQQRLMDETFELNQGRRPGDRQSQQGPLTPEEFERLMEQLQQGQGGLAEQLQRLLEEMQGAQGQQGQEGEQGQQGENGESGGPGQEMGRSLGRAGRAMGDATRSLGEGAPGDAYGFQGEALDALREGLRGMMEQMFANQPGMQGQQMGGRPQGDRDPLGRPQRTEGPDLGQSVKVPDEIDVERARRILEAIRERLGERFRPRFELDYLERLLRRE